MFMSIACNLGNGVRHENRHVRCSEIKSLRYAFPDKIRKQFQHHLQLLSDSVSHVAGCTLHTSALLTWSLRVPRVCAHKTKEVRLCSHDQRRRLLQEAQQLLLPYVFPTLQHCTHDQPHQHSACCNRPVEEGGESILRPDTNCNVMVVTGSALT